jgi:hypothetical protein
MPQTQEPPTPEARAVATRIAQRLGETQSVAVSQIWRIVRRLGSEAALAWLVQRGGNPYQVRPRAGDQYRST